MNKKAQIASVAAFIVMLVLVIIMAPIILKTGFSVIDKTSAQLTSMNMSNNASVEVAVYTRNKIAGTFDWVIMLLVIFNILLLLITSFLIDIHPAFLIIYILGVFFLVLTLPYTASVAEKIYSDPAFAAGSNNVIQYIPMTEFMLNNFGIIIVGIIVLTGIIMFAKFRWGSSQGGGNAGY